MTEQLASFLCGTWQTGKNPRPLVNPSNDKVIAEAGSAGLDLGEAVSWGRAAGGTALRAMTFGQRGKLLGTMAAALHTHRESLIDLAIANGGNTRSDAKFDIDGATQTLSYYAKLGEAIGEAHLLNDGDEERLARGPRYVGRHVRIPKHGIAIHINAFNFPAWGLFEKAAPTLLAGMPMITKPATATSLVAVRMVELLEQAEIMPEGALQILTGSVGNLLDHVGPQDVIAFTGSADTGRTIRRHDAVIDHSVPVNVEADSLNASVLCDDVDQNSETFDLFIREVARDMTQKAGQKCTAVRRIFVPQSSIDAVKQALQEEVSRIRVGDPSQKEVRMGPLTNADQLRSVQQGIDAFVEAGAEVVFGNERGSLVGIQGDSGSFIASTLLEVGSIDAVPVIHQHEVFGPVATILPYSGGIEEAAHAVALGKGSLVSSMYTDKPNMAESFVRQAGPWLGRLHIGSARIADHSMGPGTVLPQMVHGGPGRAGGGEELGGLRGVHHYLQRTALQGEKTLLEKFLGPA